MQDNDNAARPKARKPRGFRDRSGAEIFAEQAMLARITAVYAAYGFMPLETPSFEYTDALGKFLPDLDRPNQGVFSLKDDDEQWLSLRYDLTAPLARHVAEHFDALPKPFRRYQSGTVWRNEKPGPGRYREFTQCDADTVGAPAPHADAEILMMLSDAVAAAGIAPSDFVVRLSSRRIMSALLRRVGVDPADAGTAGGVLRAMDKYDRLGPDGVALLLGAGRKDESGDFTRGAGLDAPAIAVVLEFMNLRGDNNAVTLAAMDHLLGQEADGAAGLAELHVMADTLSQLGYADRVRIDPSVVRGLDYYTGSVFEAELIRPLTGADGATVQLGSLGGGGRYDDLVKRFRGTEVPAVGCSVGVSRILSALSLMGVAAEPTAPVIILALDADQMPAYQRMAQTLRQEGIAAEVYLGGAGMKAQLKYADRRGAAVAVIQGEDERQRGEVTLKNLKLGAALARNIAGHDEWKAARPAQQSVPAADLVAAVRDALAFARTL